MKLSYFRKRIHFESYIITVTYTYTYKFVQMKQYVDWNTRCVTRYKYFINTETWTTASVLTLECLRKRFIWHKMDLSYSQI